MSKWLHTIGTVLGGGLVIVSGPLQGVIGSHPTISAVLVAAYAILGHLLPSPAQPPQ